MIKNNKQLEVSEAQIVHLKDQLKQLETKCEGSIDGWAKVEKEGIISLINNIQNEVKEYQNVKTKNEIFFPKSNIGELGKMVIYARLAEGITQAELAKRLETSQQQINRFEASDYESTKLFNIIEVIEALNIDLQVDFTIKKNQNEEFELPNNITHEQFKAYTNRTSQTRSLLAI